MYLTYYHVDAALTLRGYNYKIVVCLRVYSFIYEMMSRLTAKRIIRSYSMRRQGGIAAVKPIGTVSKCDVGGGLMFNTRRYMYTNNAYFAPSTIRFPYELKNIFDRILHELQYLHREHPHHFTLDFDQLDRISEYRFIQSSSYSFPVINVELVYMFDTLGFLCLRHDSPPFSVSLGVTRRWII